MVHLTRFLVSSLVASSSSSIDTTSTKMNMSTDAATTTTTDTSSSTTNNNNNNNNKLSIDHLVYVVPDLERAMDELEERTGVRPAMGGRHLGLGTHNAFLSVGGGSYLELFAPDPQAEVPLKSLIGVDGPKPRLSTFCCDAGSIGLDELVKQFQQQRQQEEEENDNDNNKLSATTLLPTTVEKGSRTNAKDGTIISWRIAVDKHSVPSNQLPMGGVLPFYIDWGSCRNVRPGTTAPTGCILKKLQAYHPNPTELKHIVQNMIGSGLEDLLDIQKSTDDDNVPKLVAILDTPNGEVKLS